MHTTGTFSAAIRVFKALELPNLLSEQAFTVVCPHPPSSKWVSIKYRLPTVGQDSARNDKA
jgi:hypothetical protein